MGYLEGYEETKQAHKQQANKQQTKAWSLSLPTPLRALQPTKLVAVKRMLGVQSKSSQYERLLVGGWSGRVSSRARKPAREAINLGEASPFFPGIFLFRKPSNTQEKQLVLEKHDG